MFRIDGRQRRGAEDSRQGGFMQGRRDGRRSAAGFDQQNAAAFDVFLSALALGIG
jgi:hypothetical protein